MGRLGLDDSRRRDFEATPLAGQTGA